MSPVETKGEGKTDRSNPAHPDPENAGSGSTVRTQTGCRGLHNLIWTEILEHEMGQYEQEKAIAVAEAFPGVPLLERPEPGAGFELGFGARYSVRPGPPMTQEVLLSADDGTERDVGLVHEALATARQVAWAKRRAEKDVAPDSYPELLRDEILLDALPGYRDFEVCVSKDEHGRGSAAFVGLQVCLGSDKRTEWRSPGRKAADKAFGSPSRGKEPDFKKGLKEYA